MMAVIDLWRHRDGTPTKRDGRGLRWRVVVAGWPSTACRTRAEADYINAARIAQGRPRPSDGRTVGERVDVWLAGKAGLSPKGREAARVAASWVKGEWAGMPADEVDPAQVQVWLAGLRTDHGPASPSLKHKILQCLRGSIGDVADLSGVRVPSERPREPRFLSAEDLVRLADECHGWEAMVMLLGTTGIRVGECCALDVADVSPATR
ncbi:Site-specific recombinase XerC [Cutibacterium granulosum]|nr:hypothetical protein [Cutibacterium granulosum]MEA5659261.1 hypothetical protein [Cutibacterium granulosum]MEA5660783.1 hypothetical protein [Cutibacterium granulosum]SNV37911.1 Site-specific recombinase XerC [Cutibacterium granulosum]